MKEVCLLHLKAIEYFIAIVDSGSFTAAAERLYISQPALSQHIKKLESKLGAELFDRSKHSAELTAAGRLFLQEGTQLLQNYTQLLHKISLLSKPDKEVVRFGMSPFYCRYFLSALVYNLIKEYPSLEYETLEDFSHKIELSLIKGDLDFCFVSRYPESSLLTYETVFKDPVLLAVPPNSPINNLAVSINGLPSIDLKEIKDEPFIALSPNQKMAIFSQTLFKQIGFTPNVLCEIKNLDALNMLVSTGMGVGLVSSLLINRLEKSIRPRYYHLIPDIEYDYTIAYRKNAKLSPAASKTIEIFRQTFQERKWAPPSMHENDTAQP